MNIRLLYCTALPTVYLLQFTYSFVRKRGSTHRRLERRRVSTPEGHVEGFCGLLHYPAFAL